MVLVQFSLPVVSDSSQPHGLQHTSLPCPSQHLLELAQTPVHQVGNAIQPPHPLPSPSPRLQYFPAPGGQSIGVSASASVFPVNIPGLISFRIDWLDLLAIQGTLKSLLQHSSKASSLRHSSFLYGPTLTPIHDSWKNHSFD